VIPSLHRHFERRGQSSPWNTSLSGSSWKIQGSLQLLACRQLGEPEFPQLSRGMIFRVPDTLINLCCGGDIATEPADSLVQFQIQDKYFPSQDLPHLTCIKRNLVSPIADLPQNTQNYYKIDSTFLPICTVAAAVKATMQM
jgi:hypothetical protein